MAKDGITTRAQSQTGPATRLVPVTPDDDADLPRGLTRGLFVGAAGIFSVMDRHGQIAEFVSAAGQYHPIRVIRVLAAGATAGGIVALY